MTLPERLILIFLLALSVWITRFVPFYFTGKGSSFLTYVQRVLPSAMMGLLAVYGCKDFSFASFSSAVPALGGIATVVLLHLWRRNTILSISAGTAIYMLLLRLM